MQRLLLIGNSRWHWGDWGDGCLQHHWHSDPQQGLQDLREHPPAAWSAVGQVPAQLKTLPAQRLSTADVPLQQLPLSVGVDRALAAWMAWRRSGRAVFVADAGTALSFTLVDGRGCFCGGRLLAGGGLQLQALHRGTAGLPTTTLDRDEQQAWPSQTEAAMVCGVREGLTAAVVWGFAARPQPELPWDLWLTGGDAPQLLPGVRKAGLTPHHADGLALEGLGALLQQGVDFSLPVPGR